MTTAPAALRRAAARRRGAATGDGGTGLIGSVAAVVVFLAFLSVAAQVVLNLHATSIATAAAHDAVRRVAGGDEAGPAVTTAEAERRARQLLGRFGADARFTWGSDGESLSLRIEGDAPRVLLGAVSGPLGLDRIDRTVRTRIERDR